MLLALLALAQAVEPTEQAVIYYNARMALREDRPLEATRLWLLRNAVEDQTGQVSSHDDDFHSVTWASLGRLGICQDGLARDVDGAGLWPLGMHNWVVRNRRTNRPRRPRPFEAFELGRQQRFVSIGDVLSNKELSNVRLFRGACARPRLTLLEAGELPNARLTDRRVAAELLRYLLVRSRDTLTDDVIGRSVIEARLFDLDLQLTAIARREARRKAREQARKGRVIGLSRGSVEDIKDEAPAYLLDPEGEAARILRAAVEWPVVEWMALSPDRRLFLFEHARRFGGEPEALDRIAMGIVDELVAAGDGAEVEKWIGYRAPREADPAVQRLLWEGDRGARLLALDRESGFRERSVVALHRGVQHLETGGLPEALRAFAFALQHAPESRVAADVQGLSRRWLSYVAGQFRITEELLVTLQELVPRRDYGLLLEDLMWRAAFHADNRSFELGVANQLGRGALGRRLDLLRPLSKGDVGRFSTAIRSGLKDTPSETLRFLGQLVQRLELENGEIRATHLPTVRQMRRLLTPLSEDLETGRQSRTASKLLARFQAIEQGLDELGIDASARDRARSIAPGGEVFAGSVRLAPSDPLPWPFRPVEAPAPSVFTPIELTPEEWKGPDGRIYGWRIGG